MRLIILANHEIIPLICHRDGFVEMVGQSWNMSISMRASDGGQNNVNPVRTVRIKNEEFDILERELIFKTEFMMPRNHNRR
jgi:hypothetical protein